MIPFPGSFGRSGNRFRKTFSRSIKKLDIALSNCNNAAMQEENPQIKTAFSFYLPADLLAALKQVALEQRRSVNFVVTEILTEWLAKLKGE